MVKGQLKSGDKMFVVRVEHFVTKTVFATALTDNYYSKGEDFETGLTKKKAEEILRRALFFNGIYGQYEAGYFEATDEEGERYNEIYEAANEWVIDNHPYLNNY